MTIIKEGDLNRLKPVSCLKRFECDKCGCVFEADKGEYDPYMENCSICFYSKCPCCGNLARFKDNVRGAE